MYDIADQVFADQVLAGPEDVSPATTTATTTGSSGRAGPRRIQPPFDFNLTPDAEVGEVLSGSIDEVSSCEWHWLKHIGKRSSSATRSTGMYNPASCRCSTCFFCTRTLLASHTSAQPRRPCLVSVTRLTQPSPMGVRMVQGWQHVKGGALISKQSESQS